MHRAPTLAWRLLFLAAGFARRESRGGSCAGSGRRLSGCSLGWSWDAATIARARAITSSSGAGGSAGAGSAAAGVAAAGGGGGAGGDRRLAAARAAASCRGARLLGPVRSGALVDYASTSAQTSGRRSTTSSATATPLEAAGVDYKTFHPIVFHYGGETVSDAMVRLKGHSSWRQTVRDDGDKAKMQFVVSFEEVNPAGQVPRPQQGRARHAEQRPDVHAGTSRLRDDGRDLLGHGGALREQRPRDDQRPVLRPLRQRGAHRRRLHQARVPRGARRRSVRGRPHAEDERADARQGRAARRSGRRATSPPWRRWSTWTRRSRSGPPRRC